MPQRIEFEGKVHEFPDDFTDADIAAALGGGGTGADTSQNASSAPMAALGTGLALGAAKAAPGIISGLNRAAGYAKPATAVLGVVDAGRRAAKGDYTGAALSAAGTGAAASMVVPRVAQAVQRATAPATAPAARGAMSALTGAMTAGKAPGILMRGAHGLSKAAGAVAGPLSVLSLTDDTRRDLLNYLNDPTVRPDVRDAIMRAIQGGGVM